MKFSLSALTFAASLALVGAQDLEGIPQCALLCFAGAIPGSGCSATDTNCQCTTGRQSITDSIMSCVPGKCSEQEIASIATAVQNICARAGVTISDVPTAISSGGSSVSQTGSPTASTTGSAAVTGITGSPTTGTAAPQNTGAGIANVAGLGAVALGVAAAFGL